MIVLFLYSVLIFCFVFGMHKLPKTNIHKKLPQQKFSILIPFRNEEKHLNALCQSLYRLDYDKNCFEIICIDDASTDRSLQIVLQWQIKLSNLKVIANHRKSNSPKKDAIQTGIYQSKFNWILTTDADCRIPPNWLHGFNTIIHQKNSLFIAGPIALIPQKGFLYHYQNLDVLSLLGSTLGSFGIQKPIMCNAANMGFHKKTYLQLQNASSTQITSGDDVFTLEAFAENYPEQVHYLNNPQAKVLTYAETNWQQVLQQRIRWASKSTHYKNNFTKIVGIVVLLTQIVIIGTCIYNPIWGLFLTLLKLSVDFVLFQTISLKLKTSVNYAYYIPAAVVYPFVNSYVGIRAILGGYHWKERNFKR